jgi:hypothetical protein
MIEMSDLLSENEVLEKRGPSFAGGQAVLIRNGAASVTGKVYVRIIDSVLRQNIGARPRGCTFF